MFQCDKCNKEFRYNYLLKRHQKNKFACDLPNKILINNNNKITDYDNKLTKYNEQIKLIEDKIIQFNRDIEKNDDKILTITKKSLDIKNKCLFCKKIFLNKSNTSRHIESYCNKKRIN